MKTVRLTMAQALVRFMANQYVERDGEVLRFVHGVFAIFGHGNVTGLGEALEYASCGLPCYQGHNEQGMAHAATAFAKQKNRLGIMACTSSIGPGATNMVTAAATATTNRIPLLLLPGDIFACRQPDPVLQQLEVPHDYTLSVNDCFKPVSRYFDRIMRPEQLISACMNAFRVLTCPVDTGAVTLSLPQDVQSEAFDYPEAFFRKRIWHIERPAASERAILDAASRLAAAERPLLIAGGGVHYSGACQALSDFSTRFGIPVAETQAGKGSLPADHPWNVGGIGVTGSQAANRLAREADLVLVVGSRMQDFTTASKGAFHPEKATFVHINVSRMDGFKLQGEAVIADARAAVAQLSAALGDWHASEVWHRQVVSMRELWHAEVRNVTAQPAVATGPLSQTAVLGILNRFVCAEDVIVCAAGSLPGDLHRLWRSKAPKDYHLEYAYSCMGYEVAGGLGVRMAKGTDAGEVYVLVGDGSFVMLHSELLTCLQERLKITVIVFDNHGFQCIRNLQKAHGSKGFGNEFRYRDAVSDMLDGAHLPIDFVRYAEALGARAVHAESYAAFSDALLAAREHPGTSVIALPIAPDSMSRGYDTWWRVGVSEVSASPDVVKAHDAMKQRVETATIL